MITGKLKLSSSSQIDRYSECQLQLLSLISSAKSFFQDIQDFNSESSTSLNDTLKVIKPGNFYDYPTSSFEHLETPDVLKIRLLEVLGYLDKLKNRVIDNSSKILVTGDVNAGKSTFVNRLIGQDIVPSDEQPCTQTFCEISGSPFQASQSLMTIHAIRDIDKYDISEPKSFEAVDTDKFRVLMQSEHEHCYFKIYLQQSVAFRSLENNALSIIDSPGLNCDAAKTTALFAKQANIDAIVLLLNAANHLTLSSREFLIAAAVEKLHVFVIVNKMDMLADMSKCVLKVLQQIKEVLPDTFLNATSLVHFTSLTNGLTIESHHELSSFDHVQKCLEEFLIVNRVTSKLLPIRNYVSNVVCDIEKIVQYSIQKQIDVSQSLKDDMRTFLPKYENSVRVEPIIKSDINDIIEKACMSVPDAIAFELLGLPSDIEGQLRKIQWLGIFRAYHYKEKACSSMLNLLSAVLSRINARCQKLTLTAVDKIRHSVLSNSENNLGLVDHLNSEIGWSFSIKPKAESIGLYGLILDALPSSLLRISGIFFTTGLVSHFGTHALSIVLGSVTGALPKSISRLVLLIALGGSLTYSIGVDLENIVRVGLMQKYKALYCSPTWTQNIVLNYSADIRLHLSQIASAVYLKYSTLLSLMRTQWEDKNLCRRRADSFILQLNNYMQRCCVLRTSLNAIASE